MDPREFIFLAQKLLVGSPQPTDTRTATSRAYYGAFHVAAETLGKMGFSVSNGPGGHGEVRNLIGSCNDEDLVPIGSQLNDLHSSRIKADYRLSEKPPENKKNAILHVEIAKKVIQTIDRCCSGPKRGKIISEMKKYQDLISKGSVGKS